MQLANTLACTPQLILRSVELSEQRIARVFSVP
jgi:hypothetical protein